MFPETNLLIIATIDYTTITYNLYHHFYAIHGNQWLRYDADYILLYFHYTTIFVGELSINIPFLYLFMVKLNYHSSTLLTSTRWCFQDS